MNRPNPTHLHLYDVTKDATKRMAVSFALTFVFLVGEAIAGYLANSLALLTDAAHNFTDVLALGLSWYALRLTSLPANSQKTYGYHRAGILVALINSTSLVLISIGIFYEAYRRFTHPPAVKADLLIGVGLLAFAINLITAWLVRRGSDKDLNLRSAYVHLMGDVLSTLGAVIAGVVILFTQWFWVDTLVSLFIGILILWNASRILRETIQILLESTPADIVVDDIVSDMLGVEGVLGVHDLHIWSISKDLRMLSAHIVTEDIPLSTGNQIQAAVNHLIRRKYGIDHTTLQLECAECDPVTLHCDLNGTEKNP